jgi:alpha-tubulin suppressor-like RCC1 family protein
MKHLGKYLLLLGLSLIVACGNPPEPEPPPVTLIASQLNPAFGSSVTFTATTTLSGLTRKLELLEGTTVLKTVNDAVTLEQSVIMDVAGKRSFTARVTNRAGIVIGSSVVVEVDTQAIASAVVQVAMGNNHTCVLLNNNDVRCWGRNDFGQLGLGNLINIGDDEAITSMPPIKFPTGFTVKKITAGLQHTCALSVTNKVICWGRNDFGQLGYGDTTNRGGNPETTPDKLDFIALSSVKTIISGNFAFHTCAILVSEAVKCWGLNDAGQLGLGNKNTIGDTAGELENTPAINLGNLSVKEIALGTRHTCALLADGTLSCWGKNDLGQLGYGNTNNFGDDLGETPNTKAVDIDDAAQIALGNSHTCVVTTSKKVHCWGLNSSGQLGYGNENNIGDDETFATAGFVSLGANAKQLSLGALHSCVLLENNSIKCWGANNVGQLGYGNPDGIGDDELPIDVGTVEVNTDITQGKIIQIFSGATHNCVLFESGNIKCWGNNFAGQLGYGNTNNIGDNELPSGVGVVPILPVP